MQKVESVAGPSPRKKDVARKVEAAELRQRWWVGCETKRS